MKIVIKDISNKYLETIHFDNSENIDETLKNISSIKGHLEAKIFAINESLNSQVLSTIKSKIEKVNIRSLSIYSNKRDTVLAGKSLKIDSTFINERQLKKNPLLLDSKNSDDILHKGTVRSGDRISSNGNLCIIGDVNPGAIVSAKNNIYVWGKLLGIAYAGKTGNHNASISSLYLKPLQLRIADVIAIGPKEKPHNYYPEIALIDKRTIIIKPHIIETKN